jgi:AmiR/NasT family two-component response regulator
MPIILCTGYNQHASLEAAKKIGVKELFLKPFDKSRLAGIVRGVLDADKK